MSVILTAMNRFINERDGSQTAFLDRNPPDGICQPMAEYVRQRGGEVLTGCPVAAIELAADSSVEGLRLRDGSLVTADWYVSAAPVDVFKRIAPEPWRALPFFRNVAPLRGIPVINLHLFFDRRLQTSLDGLAFSRSPLLSVYADMSKSVREYRDEDRSMLELIFAPCTREAGAEKDYLKCSDDDIVDAALGELARLFPDEIAPDARNPGEATLASGRALLRKAAVVRVPRSVYAATPGMGKHRPSQRTPIRNFVLAGDWTAQKFLGSMEGAVLAGKLAANLVARAEAGEPLPDIVEPAPPARAHDDGEAIVDDAVGDLHGRSPAAFGGGQMGGLVHP